MNYKGIILAGGKGTRLHPVTLFTCKQLIPVYDKPLIYYPLTNMILADIKEILIITTPVDLPILENALGNGSQLGVEIQYAAQVEPNGLAEAFIIAEEFIKSSAVCFMLGDNILYKSHFTDFMLNAMSQNEGATLFAFNARSPTRFGVVELDKQSGQVLSIEEKPHTPKSNLISIGLYLYDNSVVAKAKSLKPSKRGELEITDLNNLYLGENRLRCSRLSRGDLWMDVGQFDDLCDASNLIRLVETHLGLKIGCPEEASFIMNNISKYEFALIAEKSSPNSYGDYLRKVYSQW